MQKLTSISDHSDWLQQLVITISERWYYHRKRVEFGKQPLNISMFIPAKLVDVKWVVLITPTEDNPIYWSQEYLLAQSNVLFEGFEVKTHSLYSVSIVDKDNVLHPFWEKDNEWILSKGIFTIEDLVRFKPTLTTTAKKQIGL